MTLPYPAPFMSLPVLAEHISSSESAIENWVRLGQFPRPIKQGGKNLWRWKDVERHLAGLAQTPSISPDDQAARITSATRAAANGAY